MIDPGLLADATAAVMGDRHDTYGNPEDNLGRIAQLWGAWIGRIFRRMTRRLCSRWSRSVALVTHTIGITMLTALGIWRWLRGLVSRGREGFGG